jgi:hypothetical protein
MTLEAFEKGQEIREQITELSNLRDLFSNATKMDERDGRHLIAAVVAESGAISKVNNSVTLSADLAEEFKNILNGKIEALEKEFEAL